MRWPPWSSKSSNNGDAERRDASWDSSHYTEPRVLLSSLVLTATTLALLRLYQSYLRRIPSATGIQEAFFRRRSLLGRVTSVGDGDNFRLFHTPGGKLAGWDWLPGRKVPTKREALKDRTVSLRNNT